EGGAGVLYRQFGVGLITAGDQAEQATVDRADALEGGTGLGITIFAVDEGAGFDGQGLGTLFPVAAGQASHSGILSMGWKRRRHGRALSIILQGQTAGQILFATLNQLTGAFQYF